MAIRFPIALRALEHRNYRLYFIGQLISLTGTWMQAVAQSWLVYRLTHSASMLGAVTFAGQIPTFFLASLGGTCADRFDRRRLLLVTQVAAMLLALGLGTLVLSERVQVWHIFLFAALLGVVNAFDMPVRHSFPVEMVGKSDLVNAIALNSAMFNTGRTVGPAVAGILVAGIGEGWCFMANAASFVAVIVCLTLMDTRSPGHGLERPSAISQIFEGFRYAVGTAPLRNLLVVLVINSIFGLLYGVLMPIFSDRILDGGVRGLGWLMASAGVGTLCGAITLAMRRSHEGLARWVSRTGYAYGIALILFASSRHFWLSALLLLPVGCFQMLQWSVANTLIQTMVPDDLRGRVMAIYSMTFVGGGPLGALLGGFLADHLGAPLAVGGSGVMCLLGAMFHSWSIRQGTPAPGV